MTKIQIDAYNITTYTILFYAIYTIIYVLILCAY